MKSKHIVILAFFALVLVALFVVFKPFQQRGKRLTLSKDKLDVLMDNEQDCNSPFKNYIAELKVFRDSLNDKEFEMFINIDLTKGHSFPFLMFKQNPLFMKMAQYDLFYVREENEQYESITIDGTRKGVIFQSMLIFQ